MFRTLAAVCAALVAACSDAPAGPAEDAAPSPAVAPGTAPLGLSEAALLDADLLALADGADLGDVAGLLHGADGQVDRLLVELDGGRRFVAIPTAGLAVLTRGDDTDLITPLTPARLAALPDAAPPTR